MYYSFIRKTVFYEDGVSINRGLPFYNNFVAYKDIASYEIIHSKLMIAIKLKETSEEIVFGVNDEDRVLSLFDKAGISGDLKTKYSIKFSINSLIMFFFILMGISVALGQTSLGLSRFLFR